MHVKHKQDYRNNLNTRLAYNLRDAIRSSGILSELDIKTAKMESNTDINNANQHWRNLKDGIVKTMEYKYPKTKTRKKTSAKH